MGLTVTVAEPLDLDRAEIGTHERWSRLAVTNTGDTQVLAVATVADIDPAGLLEWEGSTEHAVILGPGETGHVLVTHQDWIASRVIPPELLEFIDLPPDVTVEPGKPIWLPVKKITPTGWRVRYAPFQSVTHNNQPTVQTPMTNLSVTAAAGPPPTETLAAALGSDPDKLRSSLTEAGWTLTGAQAAAAIAANPTDTATIALTVIPDATGFAVLAAA